MADSILDQALALIPGAGGKRARKRPTREQRLAAVQRGLARLTRDVQKLAAMLEQPSTKPAGKRRAGTAKRPRKKAKAR